MNNTILIVQLADLGDLVLATPALAALRRARPDAHITLLAAQHTTPLLDGTGLVDDIIAFDKSTFNGTRAFFRPANLRRVLRLRQGRYQAVVFLHHFTFWGGTLKFALIAFASRATRRIGLQNGKGWFLNETVPDGGFGEAHQAQYWLSLVARLGASPAPHPAQVAIDRMAVLPAPPPAAQRVVIHPGGGGYSLARRWSPEDFAQVADALHARWGVDIVLVGGPNDDTARVKAAMRHPVHDLTGQTTLAQLAGILAAADLFIGAESGVMHLAAAAGTPLVAIFGPGNPAAWGPWTPNGQQIVVRSAPLCSPCSYVGHSIGLREGCPARTCIRMVTPDSVIDAAERLLRRDPPEEAAPRTSARDRRPDQRLTLLNIPVDAITYAEWLDQIREWVRAGEPARQVCTVNPEFVMMAQHDTLFRSILNRAALCVPDGVGLLWAARWLRSPLPERVTGSDGLPLIAEHAAREGWRLFLLGAAPGIAHKAADVLRERFPGIQIVGAYSGSPAPEEEDEIAAMVNASGAHLLFVAYGAPKQDAWIARNLPRLNVQMAMGVGGSLDFIAGVIPRAPLWMRRAGVEWLFRLYLQPRRIGRMMRLPRFVMAVLLRERRRPRSHSDPG